MFLSNSLKEKARAFICESEQISGAVPIPDTPLHICTADTFKSEYKGKKMLDVLGGIKADDGIVYVIGSLRKPTPSA